MGKLLLWIAVIIAVLFVTRLFTHKKPAIAPPRKGAAPAPKGTEEMVRCAHCGIYLPRSEALMSNHHTWCSVEHSRLGVKR